MIGDIKGRAVVRRSADIGKPERHVHTVMERDKLKGRERLVMLHGDEGVAFSVVSGVKEKVG